MMQPLTAVIYSHMNPELSMVAKGSYLIVSG